MSKILLINPYEKFSQEYLDKWVVVHPNHQFVIVQSEGVKESDVVSLHPDCDVLICTYGAYNEKLLSQMPNLKAVIASTTAKEYVDLDYCKKKGIAFFNTSGYTGSAVAEHLIAFLFVLARNLIPKPYSHSKDLSEKKPSIELHGKTVGVLGYGHIGKQVCKMLEGLGMKVIVYNRSPITDPTVMQMDLEPLLSKSQVLVCALPLTSETRLLLNHDKLSLIPKGGLIVSTSPDAIFDMEALKAALKCGALGGVALDHHMTASEFADTPNFFATPAVAWYTKECVARRTQTFLTTLDDFLAKTLPFFPLSSTFKS